jgi:hypothetical protein
MLQPSNLEDRRHVRFAIAVNILQHTEYNRFKNSAWVSPHVRSHAGSQKNGMKPY